jgi:Putative beta barrel porin-7 (BBP7)
MTPRIAVALWVTVVLVGDMQAQAPDPAPSESRQAMPSSPDQALPSSPPGQTMPSSPGQAMPSLESMMPEQHGFVPPDACAPASCSSEWWWARADYLFAWTRASSLPPLVTTSPPGTAQGAAGVLGQPGTTILFGNSNVDEGLRSGIRFSLGGWIDNERTFGIDTGFFVLESKNALFSASSTGNPILARPFNDVTNANTPASQVIAFPGVSTGSVTGSDGSNNVYEFHADFQEAIVADQGFRLSSLLGYRFLRYTDRLAMDSDIVSAGGGGIIPGTTIMTSERFTAQNNFHGGDFGIKTEYSTGPWSFELLTKLAVGNTQRSIGIHGTTTTTVPGSAAVTQPGGFLALSSNTGVFNSNDWVAIPELGLNAHWSINDHVKVGLGYSFLYWSGIAHGADQVSLNLNPNLFPPPTPGATPLSPTFQLNKSELWIQSVSLGLELKY